MSATSSAAAAAAAPLRQAGTTGTGSGTGTFRHRVLCALLGMIEDANDHCHGYSEHNVFSKDKEDGDENGENDENEQNYIPSSGGGQETTDNDNNNGEEEETGDGDGDKETGDDGDGDDNKTTTGNFSVVVPQPPTSPPSIMKENLPPPQDGEKDDDEDDDEQDAKPYCVVNESGGTNGNFHFGDASYTQYVTIEYMYQVQGTLDLSAQALRQDVLPQLDRSIANMFLPELFAPDLCIIARSSSDEANPLILHETEEETIIAVDQFHEILPPNNEHHDDDRRRRYLQGDDTYFNHFETQSDGTAAEASSSSSSSSLLGSAVGPSSGSRVTGMSARPVDTLLPGYAGVQCRSSLVPGAARCYIVRGGITLTGTSGDGGSNNGGGGGDLAWAVPLVESMLEKYAYDGDQRTAPAAGAGAGAAQVAAASSTSFLQPQQDSQQQQQEEADLRQERVDDLAAAFPSVINVRFLSLQQPEFDGNFPYDNPVGSGGGNRDTDVGIFSEGNKIHAISNWTWVVVSFAAVFVFVYGIFLCRRKVCRGCGGGRHNESHYRLQDADADGYDTDENKNGTTPRRSGVGYGDDSPQPSPSGGEGVTTMGGRPSMANNHATSGTRTSSSLQCPSWTRIPSSLDEESLSGSSQHLEIDEGGGTIYHQTHQGDIVGEEPVIPAPTQSSIIAGSFVEASVTSLTTGSFEANRDNAPPPAPSSSFPVADNSNVFVVDDVDMVDNDHVVEVANHSNHQSHTVIEDIESSISTDNDDDGRQITIFPQPVSIPSSSSPSGDTANGDNNQDPDHFDAKFDDSVQHEHHRPGLQEDNKNDPTIIAASSADGNVLHYKDSTRPPIDLNNIVGDLENLASASFHSFHDDDDNDFAVSADGADEESDLSSSAGSASNSEAEGGKDSNTSGSSSNEGDGGEGSWRAMIV